MAGSQQRGGKRRNSGEPAQHSSVNHRCAAHPKENLDADLAVEIGYGANRSRTYRYASSARHRLLRDDPLLRFRDDKPASIPNCSFIRASRPTAIVGHPPLVSGRVFPRDPKEPRLVLRSRVKELRPRAALTVDF